MCALFRFPRRSAVMTGPLIGFNDFNLAAVWIHQGELPFELVVANDMKAIFLPSGDQAA
jgi:hypothetical protein